MNFQRILWVIAGAEPSILENCPTDYKKFSSIGATILMTSFIAFLAGTSAAWYFTTDGGEETGHLGWSLMFGFVWALLIFCIDRSLVITLKKDPSQKKQSFLVPFLSRAVLALIIAFMVSVPLELFIFKDYIALNMETFKLNEAIELGQKHKKHTQEDKVIQDIGRKDEEIKELKNQSEELKGSIKDLERRIYLLKKEKEIPNSSAYINANNRYNTADKNYNTAKVALRNELAKEKPSDIQIKQQQSLITKYRNEMDAANTDKVKEAKIWKESKQAEIDKLEEEKSIKETEKNNKDDNVEILSKERAENRKRLHDITQKREESEQKMTDQMEKGNKFLKNFQILESSVLQKDSEGNLKDKAELCFLWLIRILFFIIEILPTVVKIVTPVGSYDRMVYAREKSMEEYLNSQEFMDSMKEIHRTELQTQLNESKMTQDVELQMKKEILERMTKAQLDVANVAITKWEIEEKKKLYKTPSFHSEGADINSEDINQSYEGYKEDELTTVKV